MKNIVDESDALESICACLVDISNQLNRIAELLSAKDAAFAAGMTVSAAWSIESIAAVVKRHCDVLKEMTSRN